MLEIFSGVEIASVENESERAIMTWCTIYSHQVASAQFHAGSLYIFLRWFHYIIY